MEAAKSAANAANGLVRHFYATGLLSKERPPARRRRADHQQHKLPKFRDLGYEACDSRELKRPNCVWPIASRIAS